MPQCHHQLKYGTGTMNRGGGGGAKRATLTCFSLDWDSKLRWPKQNRNPRNPKKNPELALQQQSLINALQWTFSKTQYEIAAPRGGFAMQQHHAGFGVLSVGTRPLWRLRGPSNAGSVGFLWAEELRDAAWVFGISCALVWNLL